MSSAVEAGRGRAVGAALVIVVSRERRATRMGLLGVAISMSCTNRRPERGTQTLVVGFVLGYHVWALEPAKCLVRTKAATIETLERSGQMAEG